MNDELLEVRIETLASQASPALRDARDAVAALLDALEHGEVRAAYPEGDGWIAPAWVKRGILLAFRIGVNHETVLGEAFHFRDRDTLPTRGPDGGEVRIVPGGTTVRRGAHLGRGVVIMPPAYVNVGAWVGDGSMIDSHALVGSCAQIGARVHLSAAAQVGGVLEPVGALPVIIEDDVFVGGGVGIYEGARVRRGAVLAPGVVLTRAVPIHDLVHERLIRASSTAPLEVPEGAVVVPGSRPAAGAFARGAGIQLAAPVIVKYRDDGTSAALELERALR